MNKVIRGYQIEEEIGEGGFGKVYRAFQSLVEREVAIKAILPVHANQPDFIHRFEAEAQLVARLEHPHIVPLYDYWREPDGAYLVMRWLRGGSLLESLKRDGPWPLEDTARLLNHLAGALSVAHRNRVIHQDIKPANVLLDDDRNIYLTDFGIAQDLTTGLNLAKGDQANMVLGTPAYMSPEHLTRQPITAQSDIYSLGVVLFEVLTGKTPFAGAGLTELLNHQINTPLPSLQVNRPDIPEPFDMVIMQATAKDPLDRYQDVLKMAADFQFFLTQMTVHTSLPPQRVEVAPSQMSNPYKGLRGFNEADSTDFFGRNVLIRTLLKRITRKGQYSRFLAVVGPSGSGKSSVVKAGVIPAIRDGQVMGLPRSFIVDMTPGAEPMRRLEGALLRVALQADDAFMRTLASDDYRLTDVVDRALPDDGSELILVIDQFEELFTLVDDEAVRRHFMDMLLDAVKTEDSRLRILITLRADFYDRPLMYGDFGEVLHARMETVLPLTAEEIEQAITGPAENVGVEVEPGLVNAMVADVSKQPSALPLLQYTLTELFEQREQNRMTLHAYREFGGISGALARRADEIYDDYDAQKQSMTQQLFLRLVRLGEGTEDTRRRVLQSEVYSIEGDRKAMRDVMDAYGRYRLLTFDHDPITRAPTVEVAHEALIRSWDRLRGWLNDNRDVLHIQTQLSAATREWLDAGREASFLVSGVRLESFEQLASDAQIAINDDERAFLQASIAQRQRQVRRQRVFIALLFMVAIAAVAASVLAVIQQQAADDARAEALVERDRADQEARISRSRELAASALTVLEQPDLSLLLSLEAIQTYDTFEARNSLLLGLESYPSLVTQRYGHTDAVRAVEYSPDGRYFISASRDNTLRLWDAETNQALHPPMEGHEGWVNTVTFSPDGRQVASGGVDGRVIVWDVVTGTPIGEPLVGHTEEVRTVAFSPDGTWIASGGIDGRVMIWDAATGEVVNDEVVHDNAVYSLAFDPSGMTLAAGDADGVIRLWDMAAGDYRELEGHQNWVLAVDFSPDGRILASGSADTSVRLWDVERAEALGRPLMAHNNWVRSVDFHHSGQLLASGGSDGEVRFWDVAGEFRGGFRQVADSAVWDVAFDPVRPLLAVAGTYPGVTVWALQPEPALGQVLRDHTEEINALVYTPSIIATAGGQQSGASDTAIRLWDPGTGELVRRLPGHDLAVMALDYCAESDVLVSVGLDRTLRVWNLTEEIARYALDVDVFALTCDGDRLAMGTDTGVIQLWDIGADPAAWSLVDELTGHEDRIWSLDLEADILVSGSRDRSVGIWNLPTGERLHEIADAHTDAVLAVVLNPGATMVASGGRDELVWVWDVATGDPLTDEPLRGHENWVMALAFSPDGEWLASGSIDETAILWNVAVGRQLALPFVGHSQWVMALDFSPDSRTMASGGREGDVILWSIGLDAWQSRACQIANRDLTAEELRLYFDGQSVGHTCEG